MQHQLNGELVAALAATAPDEERLRQASKILRSDPDGVRRLLTTVARDRSVAAKAARDSYWHANGFAKLTLDHRLLADCSLRMHIWTAGPSRGAAAGGCNTHTHRWAFSSLLLHGSLAVEEFEEVAPSADPKAVTCRKLVYETPTSDVAGTLRTLGTCQIRPTGSAIYGGGDIHSGGLPIIHRVTPVGDEPVATLFVQGPMRVTSAFVYEEAGAAVLEDTGTVIERADVMALADLVLSALPRHDFREDER